jgi:hypothetical protein
MPEHKPARRLLSLAKFMVEALETPDLVQEQRELYDQRVADAVKALLGADTKPGRRELIKEAVKLYGDDLYFADAMGTTELTEPAAIAMREQKRAQQALKWISAAAPELADELDTKKLIVALRACTNKPGRGKKAAVTLGEALEKLLSDTDLGQSPGRTRRSPPKRVAKKRR